MYNLSIVIVYLCLFLSFLLVCLFLAAEKGRKRVQGQERAKLPPGSLGWPIIGETIQLYSQDPNVFFLHKQKRYGEIFKTHILGCPCILLASPEAAKFVFVTHADLFKPTYPKSKEKMIGPAALFFHDGEYHNFVRKLVRTSFSIDNIKKRIPEIESLVVASLESWATGRVVNTFQEMKKLSFNVGVLSIFGHLDSNFKEQLIENYRTLDKGYNCFPTNIPGTAYYKALKARKKLNEILCELIRERKKNPVQGQGLIDYFLSSQNDGDISLSEDQIADNVIGVLFAAQDTTASIMTWILKYLADNDELRRAVEEEQTEVMESTQANRSLTWSQTRNMPLTQKIILESLRMSSIISFAFREAVVDVEYKGYLIPRGWKVMPLFRNIHHNPEYFSDPQIFKPCRFEDTPKPNTFMPFGNGAHACPGNELAKLEILVLVHHLVTKFRWEVEKTRGGVQYGPFPIPRQGLPARFSKIEGI